MSEQLHHKSRCYVYLLSKAYQKGHGLVQKRLLPYGLTNIQYVVLELLWHREGLTAGEIGRLLVIDKATLSDVLDRMVIPNGSSGGRRRATNAYFDSIRLKRQTD